MGRAEKRIIRDRSSECWDWQSSTRAFGYGQVTFCQGAQRVTLSAHRVIWQLFYGAIPSGMCVCHHCDNPACCNPDHLFLGTRSDNNKDMFAKGRARPGPKTKGYRRPEVSGERSGASKLSWAQVRSMRADYARGGVSAVALGKKYGIGRTAAANILSGATWHEDIEAKYNQK
jgi:hypothetical protein